MSNGLEKLLQNVRVFEQEAEAIRARSARLGIYLGQMAAELEKATKSKNNEENVAL